MMIPASTMGNDEPGSTDVLVNRLISQVGMATLISWQTTTVHDKYRQLCYWRQVVNASNN
ncbi:MAG TPA: hypothetical protein VNC61_01500 [Acidimicrobiales bacterium]|nr:hypothetical protein [Acidimicrobiales bacterium]